MLSPDERAMGRVMNVVVFGLITTPRKASLVFLGMWEFRRAPHPPYIKKRYCPTDATLFPECAIEVENASLNYACGFPGLTQKIVKSVRNVRFQKNIIVFV